MTGGGEVVLPTTGHRTRSTTGRSIGNCSTGCEPAGQHPGYRNADAIPALAVARRRALGGSTSTEVLVAAVCLDCSRERDDTEPVERYTESASPCGEHPDRPQPLPQRPQGLLLEACRPPPVLPERASRGHHAEPTAKFGGSSHLIGLRPTSRRHWRISIIAAARGAGFAGVVELVWLKFIVGREGRRDR